MKCAILDQPAYAGVVKEIEMKKATKNLNLASDTIRLLTTSDVGSVHGGVYEPLLPTSKRTCLSVDVPCTNPPVR